MDTDSHFRLLNEWEKNKHQGQQDRKAFLESLASKDVAKVSEMAHSFHKEVFEEVDCLKCANCCKTTPPIYTNKDVKRIAAFLGTTPKQFKRKYTIEDVNGELVGIKVPCSFLLADNMCSIYEVRPFACRTYPHTDDPAFAERPELNHNNTMVCPAAYLIVERLRSAVITD